MMTLKMCRRSRNFWQEVAKPGREDVSVPGWGEKDVSMPWLLDSSLVFNCFLA